MVGNWRCFTSASPRTGKGSSFQIHLNQSSRELYGYSQTTMGQVSLLHRVLSKALWEDSNRRVTAEVRTSVAHCNDTKRPAVRSFTTAQRSARSGATYEFKRVRRLLHRSIGRAHLLPFWDEPVTSRPTSNQPDTLNSTLAPLPARQPILQRWLIQAPAVDTQAALIARQEIILIIDKPCLLSTMASTPLNRLSHLALSSFARSANNWEEIGGVPKESKVLALAIHPSIKPRSRRQRFSLAPLALPITTTRTTKTDLARFHTPRTYIRCHDHVCAAAAAAGGRVGRLIVRRGWLRCCSEEV